MFLRGWKTRIVSAAIFLIGLLDIVNPDAIAALVNPAYAGWIVVGYSILKYVMHEITLLENEPSTDDPQRPP